MSEHSATPARRSPRPVGRAVKAVIPAAGLATRFLPATKAVPKELLPVVDRPVLQYIVEEAAAAGIGDVLLVTGRGKTSMVDHFDRRPDLEARLEEKGDLERLAAVTPAQRAGRDLHLPAGRAARPRPRGRPTPSRTSATSRSRCCSATSSSSEAEPLLPAMLDLQARTGGIVLAFIEVDAGGDQAGTASPRSSRPSRSWPTSARWSR